MEEMNRRVQTAIQNMMEDLDRSAMRAIQGDTHRCAAKCCDDTNASLEQVHRCVTKCGEDITKANNYVTNELSNFQRRMDRCAMDCQDKIRDKVSPNATNNEIERYKGEFEDCVFKCVDTNMHFLPNMAKRMKEALQSKNYPKSNLI